MSATTASEGPSGGVSGVTVAYAARWSALFVILAAECMDLLDGTIVNVAMPAIRSDLGGSGSSIQWIAGGYALAFAALLITGARLGDAYGRKRLFMLGVAGFTLASVACSLAPSVDALISFRLVQGLAAALMVPQGLAIIRSMFPRDEIAKAFSIFGPVIGGSAVLGPIIGGLLVNADLFGSGWRLVFLVNLPVGIAALAAAWRYLPESRAPESVRIDLLGAILSGAAMLLVIYPLIEGREKGWPWWTYASVVAAVAVAIVFVWHARRSELAGRPALITTSLLRKRAFSAGLLVGLAIFGTMGGMLLTMTLYMQLGLGFTALHAGLTMVPLSVGLVIGSGLSGAVLGPRYGRVVLLAGGVVMLAGALFFAAAAGHWGARADSLDLAGPLVLTGLGIGLLIAPFFNIVLASVDDPEVGSASGVLNAVQQLAGALGIAVLGTIFFSILSDQHGAASQGQAFATSIQRTFLYAAIGIAAMIALMFLLPRRAREDVMAH